jgi:hypothetical protein
MSNSKNPDMIKPISGALAAVIADKFILNQNDMTRSLYWGAAVGVGLYGAQILTPMMPVLIPTATLSNGKTIEDRAVEIAAGSVGGYAINRYVLKNDFNTNDMYKRIGIVALADFVGTYTSEYMNNQPLSYLY